MNATPEHLYKGSNQDALLQVFDYLYAETADRPVVTITHDRRRQMEEAMTALLASLTLLNPESSKSGDVDSDPAGQRHLEQAHLVLGPEGIIESFSMSIPDTLGYPTIRLAGRPFSTLLTDASANSWEGLLALMEGRISYSTTIPLTLLSLHWHPVPALCTISKMLNSRQLYVSCLFVLEHLSVAATISKYGSSRNDAQLMQKLHGLILQHLDRPLPTIPQLAKLLGTNTFTLKDGFKHYFNMGIYQCYTNERLAKAKLLLLEANLSLTAIAEQCGFSSMATFSKAFKKKYGTAPLPFKKARQKTITC